jgi:hypothetical protein
VKLFALPSRIFVTKLDYDPQTESLLMNELFEFLRMNAALTVSVFALFLTISNAKATRRHNRVTVQPRMATFITRDADPNDPLTYFVKAELRNSGLGPAIIKKFEILLDGIPVIVKLPGDLFPVFSKAIAGEIVQKKCTFALLNKGHTMAKDEVFQVVAIAIRVPFDPTVEDGLDKFHLRVTYESAYGESFCYDSRDHRR